MYLRNNHSFCSQLENEYMRAVEKHQDKIIKLLFLLSYSAGAVWLTFFYVYLKDDAGLSGFEIGMIAGLQNFNNIFILPIWGILADRYGRKRMLVVAIGITALLLPGFMFLQGAATITLLVIFITFTYNPLPSLIDTIALDYEAQSEGKTSYGEFRLWASIGWGGASMLAGLFINTDNLIYIFPIASALFILTWVILFSLYKPLKTKANISKLRRGVIWDILVKERTLLIFFILIFIYSIFSSPVYLMINVYFSDIGASTKILGLAILVQGLCELPFFFFGKRIIERFGNKKVLIFTMAATGVRMFLYAINHSPEWAVVINMINGISVGLFFVSITAFVHRIIPSELRSTGQSLLFTFYAVGVALGNLLTGVIFDYFGIHMAMFIDGIGIALLIIIVLFSKQSIIGKDEGIEN